MKNKLGAVAVFIIILGAVLFQSVFADEIQENEPVNGAVVSPAGYEQDLGKPPRVDAGAAVVIDAKSGRILYEKNAFSRRAMASTTKIMTAIVAIENGRLEDEVTVSKRAASVGGSNVGLRAGQVLSLKELLYGLMLNSGNDAAIAIAEHTGGSVEEFLEMMNRKAEELGLKDSSFKSPHGLDMDGHYSTAYDMAMITRYALKNKIFAAIVSTKSAHISSGGLYNTNEMLDLYPGADGVKTGYTGLAGRCLVTSAMRNNFRIISVVLNCPTRTIRARDSKNMLDYAFENYKPYILLKRDENMGQIPVIKGIKKFVPVKAVEGIEMPLTIDEANNMKKEIELPDTMPAPVSSNVEIGNIKFVLDGKVMAQSPIKTCADIRRKEVLDYLKDIVQEWARLLRPQTIGN